MKSRLIGKVNENYILIEGIRVKALIDTGSMVSTMSDTFYHSLKEKPELKTLNDFNLDLKAANGLSVPYLGYVECDINTDFLIGNGLTIPILVVPSTCFNEQVHRTSHVFLVYHLAVKWLLVIKICDISFASLPSTRNECRFVVPYYQLMLHALSRTL